MQDVPNPRGKIKASGARRRTPSLRLMDPTTRFLRFDCEQFSSLTHNWPLEKIGLLMALVQYTWRHKQRFDPRDDFQLARRILWLDVRKIKRLCDDELMQAVLKLTSQRKSFEPGERESIFVRSGGFCHYCGEELDPDDWHADHVVPVAAGGLTVAANLVASCAPCNRAKGARQ